MRKVLIIHRYFWPENVAVLPLMLKEVVHSHLMKNSHVTVVCGSSEPNNDVWKKEFPENVTIVPFDARIDRRGTKLTRIKNSLKLFFYSVRQLVRVKDYSIVYVVSYPPFFAGAVSFVVKNILRRKSKVVYYLQDNHRYFLTSRTLIWFFEKYNRNLVAKCDATITLSASMKSALLEHFPSDQRDTVGQRIHVIGNYSTDLAEDVKPNKQRSYDVIYAGNHGAAQNLYHFIDSIASLIRSKEISIVFYGDGSEKNSLIDYATAKDVKIDFREPVGRKEIAIEIAKAKFGLVAAQPELMKYAFPSKLAAYNSVGTKAIVFCESALDLAHHLTTEGIGYPIDPSNVQTASQQLFDVLGDTSESYDGDHVQDAAERLYGKHKYLEQLNKLTDELIS